MPAPMIPTASALTLLLLGHKPERIGHHAARLAAGGGDERQLHRHADAQAARIRLGQPGLDPDLSRKLDVPDAVRLERVRIIDRVRWRLRREALNGPRPQRSAPRQLPLAY